MNTLVTSFLLWAMKIRLTVSSTLPQPQTQSHSTLPQYPSSGQDFALDKNSDHLDGCQAACRILKQSYPHNVIQIEDGQYWSEKKDYFSCQQSNVSPRCFFTPANEKQVSDAVQIVQKTACRFSVKSGGHASFEGASNTKNGLTIILRKIGTVEPSFDHSIVKVGTGLRWSDVYSALEPDNITVAGGRTGSVGVGGLALGGGLSFFSGLHGFTTDNIANFRAVLASGAIVDANYTCHQDLYWALRGGGNNFAVVTEIDMYSIPNNLMWGGIRNYTCDHTERVVDAYVDFGKGGALVPNEYQITTLYFSEGMHSSTIDLYNTSPEPSSYLLSLVQDIPYESDTTAVRSHALLSWRNFQGQPDGLRQTYWTTTFKLDRDLAHYIRRVYDAETEVLKHVRGIEARNIMQVITPQIMTHMRRNGGNAMGIDNLDEPLMLLNLAFRWEDPNDDKQVMDTIMSFLSRVEKRAKDMGIFVPFKYMNYASEWQDVIGSYGPDKQAKLMAVAKKYDPDGVFQTLQPGHFKLQHNTGSSFKPSEYIDPEQIEL